MSLLGSRVGRVEDRRLLTGEGAYVDDIDLPDCLHVSFVASPVAHGVIRRVDIEAARHAPGVVGVFTADDLPLQPLPSLIPPGAISGFPGTNPLWARPILARERVRFVGEAVVAIVTQSRSQGSDACELVEIDIDPLPAVVDPEVAAADEVLLFPEVGTNVMSEIHIGADDPLVDADVIIRQRVVNQRISSAALEPRAAAASWADGRLTYYASAQGPSMLRMMLSMFLGLSPQQIRVVTSDVGGSFGARSLLSTEELVVGWLSMQLGRPVRWVETRSDSMRCMPHGRAQIHTVEMGARSDGTVVGVRLDVVQDCGAYPHLAPMLPAVTWLMLTGPYAIPRVAFTSRAVTTTTTPVGAFRGAGRPEATFALERAMDLLAAELGLDAIEVRRRNLLRADQFPYPAPTGLVYDSGDYLGALDRATAAAGYDELRAEQRQRRLRRDAVQLGVGVSTYVEITNPLAQPEACRVRVDRDGSARVFTGSAPHGQGHETTWAMIASDRLGIALDRITVVYGDTDVTPAGGATAGSRSAQTAGVVVSRASEAVVERAKQLAAELLEAAAPDVQLDTRTGQFHVVGTPTRRVSWEMVTKAAGEALEAEVAFEAGPSFPFGAHVAVVEVDTETGAVKLRRLVACDDCGRILNPILVEGQVHGGAAQGVGQALFEEVVFDSDGNPLTSTFADYLIVSTTEIPSFEVVSQETPTPNNELGAKGIGESGTIGSVPAVVNAVLDALAPYGIRHIDMPLSPMRVWEALQAAESRQAAPTKNAEEVAAMQLKAGLRLKSSVCETQVIVIRAPQGEVEIACGGAPMVGLEDSPVAGASLDPAQAEGTLLGKRYASEALGIELLCTKPGRGTLYQNGERLQLKEAKALPSSD